MLNAKILEHDSLGSQTQYAKLPDLNNGI